MSNSLQTHESQHARPPCPSPTPGVHSDSTSIESVMPSCHLILCRPLLLLPPIPPSIRVFSNESALQKRWPKYWSFSLSISPSNEHPGLLCFKFRSILPLIKMSQPQINLLSISYLRCFLQVYPSVSFFDLQASFSSSQNLLT